MNNVWKQLDPADGFIAKLVLDGEIEAKVVFGLRVKGEQVKERVIVRVKWPSAHQLGEMKRQLIFWEGVAEYLNAGGALNDVCMQLENIKSKFEDICISFPGWLYFDTGVNTNGNRVHEFIKENKDNSENVFVRWVRNEFVDVDLKENDMVDDNYEYETAPTETHNFG